MRLQSRLALTFLLVAWIPLGVAVGVLTDNTERAFEATFEARRAGVEAAVRARLLDTARQVDRALELVAGDPVLAERLLQPLARGIFYGDQERERAIVREAERLITSPAVDTLRLVDLAEGGRVIAMGHRRGVEEPDAEAVEMARMHPGKPFLRHERVENAQTGATDRVWTLQVARPVAGRIGLVGGRVLDRALLTELLVGSAGGGEVALDDAADERVAATFATDRPPPVAGGYDELATRISNPGRDESVAVLRTYVSRAELVGVVGQLWQTAGLLAGVTALLALLVGIWSARRISRPLERLAVAAAAVAAGERQEQVPELRGRDEVAQLTRAFNRMTEDLHDSEERLRQSERVAAWREIARRIAHEIKNPLFPIQMAIETLKKVWERRHPDFEDIFEESTSTILEEVGRMKRIVTEFSDFARMPAPRPEATDLSALATQIVGLHAEVSAAVDVTIDAPRPAMAVVDADQLRQVMTNLIKNAIEAFETEPRDGASVRVTVGAGADRRGGEPRVRLVVADNGPGIPEESLERLFVPYFTTRSAGTGLGLAIVHRIVTEHGGSVDVRSTLGEGTEVVVSLPLGDVEGGLADGVGGDAPEVV